MKKILITFAFFLGVFSMNGQIQPAAPGVVYGKVSEEGNALPVDKLSTSLKENKYEGKITGEVAEVCQAEGCWIRIKKQDGSLMMVRAKDHAFFMPTNLVGKKVIIEGEAEVKEVSEAMRKHYAEDAGKSKQEIKKIKGTEKEIVFQAKGVRVI
jgi:hypothetical protein